MNRGKSMSEKELLEIARKLYGPTAFVIGSDAWCPPQIKKICGRSSVWAGSPRVLKHKADDNYVNGETMKSLLKGKSSPVLGFGIVEPVSFGSTLKYMVEGVIERGSSLCRLVEVVRDESGSQSMKDALEYMELFLGAMEKVKEERHVQDHSSV